MKHIQIASLKKRLLSSLIDLTIIAGLFCLFYFLVFTKIVASVQNYSHLNEIVNQEKLSSGLFIEKNGSVISILQDDTHAGEDKLAKRTKEFYTVYYQNKNPDKNYNDYWYNTHILYLEDVKHAYDNDDKIVYPEKTLYVWEDNETCTNIVRKEQYKDDNELYNDFYRANYANAMTTLLVTEPSRSAAITMSWGNIRAALYSSIIATIIPCFIIPISLKNGKTVGKLVTKLVVLTDEGYEYKRYKHIFRYLAFYMIEVFGGVVTIGLTLILTTTLTLFTRKRRALHDYIAFSVVVDEVNSVFYKDYDEEIAYQKKSMEKLTA